MQDGRWSTGILTIIILASIAQPACSITQASTEVAHLRAKVLVQTPRAPRDGSAAYNTTGAFHVSKEPHSLLHINLQAIPGQSKWSVPVAIAGFLLIMGLGGTALYYQVFMSSHRQRLKKSNTLLSMDSIDQFAPGESELQEVCEHWLVFAETGELDVYTCMGLSNGSDHFGPRTRNYIPLALMLVIMHFILPSLLLAYEVHRFSYWSENQDLTYRLIGFILYLYSVLHMYTGAVDECRSILLNLALYRDISIWYIGPLLVGEIMNAYTSFTLTLVLFFVFCETSRPVELLIKCIAINFVIEVDNNWLTEDMRKDSIELFKRLQTGLLTPDADQPAARVKSFEFGKVSPRLQGVVEWVTFAMRVGGTLCTGFCLSLLFFVAKQDEFCGYFQPYSAWPVCLS